MVKPPWGLHPRDVPPCHHLIPLLAGLVLGYLSGLFLPWWISGIPCYVGAAIVWCVTTSKRTALLFLCGALTSAAAMGFGLWWPPLVVLAVLLIFRATPRWIGITLWVLSTAVSAIASARGTAPPPTRNGAL